MSQATVRLVVDAEALPAAHIAEAAALLRAGRLVAFPTETVYGLGADATNAEAVAGIFAAKQRPFSDPLIVHIADLADAPRVVADFPLVARELARRFWPGPLTLVLPRAEGIPPIVSSGGATVGLRIPAHPVALALLRAAGVPVAAPSANRFMHTSPTTAAHVLADLDGRIAAVLDGGPCAVGVESTVVDLTSAPPRLLRPGGVTLEQLRAVIPDIATPTAHTAQTAEVSEGVARAPGQMPRHYAPHTRLIVYDATGEAGRAATLAGARRALAAGLRVGALVPDEEASALAALGVIVEPLGLASAPAEQARRLYVALRALDAQGCDLLLAHTFPHEGLGLALADRLRRAAGGRLTPPEPEE